MAILKNLKRWFLLTLARLTAISTLIFAFEQGIQGIRNDVRRFRDCRASGSNCQPPQQLIVGPSGSPGPIDASITGLVPESTVPFHRSGFFFACLHWAFYLLSLVVLLLIELPNCSRLHRIVEALVSLLLPVNHHSIAPQGAAMVYMGLDVNSRSVPKDTRVSGWLLMVVGFVYIFLVRYLLIEHYPWTIIHRLPAPPAPPRTSGPCWPASWPPARLFALTRDTALAVQ